MPRLSIQEQKRQIRRSNAGLVFSLHECDSLLSILSLFSLGDLDEVGLPDGGVAEAHQILRSIDTGAKLSAVIGGTGGRSEFVRRALRHMIGKLTGKLGDVEQRLKG